MINRIISVFTRPERPFCDMYENLSHFIACWSATFITSNRISLYGKPYWFDDFRQSWFCDGPNVTLFIHIFSHIWRILWNRCDFFDTYTIIYEKMSEKIGKFHIIIHMKKWWTRRDIFHIWNYVYEKRWTRRDTFHMKFHIPNNPCFSSVFHEWSHIYKICHIFDHFSWMKFYV